MTPSLGSGERLDGGPHVHEDGRLGFGFAAFANRLQFVSGCGLGH